MIKTKWMIILCVIPPSSFAFSDTVPVSLTVKYGETVSENCQDSSVCNDLGIENVVHLRRRVYLCQDLPRFYKFGLEYMASYCAY